DLRDLLDRDEREQRSRPGAADLLGEEEAEDPLVAEELDDVPRELVRRVDLGRTGRDPLARHRSNELAQLALLLAQDVPGHATKCKRAEPGSWRRRGRRPSGIRAAESAPADSACEQAQASISAGQNFLPPPLLSPGTLRRR